METVSEKNKSASSRDAINKVDEIKNLTKTFLKKVKKFSQIQKINLIYFSAVGKKPGLKLDIGKKLDRILFEHQFGKQIKDTAKKLKSKKKYKFPFKWLSIMKKGTNKGRQILVWYLNAKGVIEPPALYPIYSSDMIIIRNKPHQVDPRAFWRLGKYQCLLIKEIDRRPVSNLDYDEIKRRGDSTDSDEFIIKAAMRAVVGEPKKTTVNKTTMIIIGIIVFAGLIYFMSK